MIVPQLYLNGTCCEAIELYKTAFNTETDSIMFDTQREPEKIVIHAEMHVLGTRLMLSDFGGTRESSADTTMEIVAIFENDDVLRKAYQVMNDGSKTITPIGPTFYSPCLVQFIDKFGVRWCFMV
ncbi:VOC family protein [Paenibacillus anaericanus]|uniref:VOC family protein n=1 Tax=Paenibacillus anaericanus TaxID=170367 RepID=A0A433Y645_9BACL|nr:VOC family protein [Paenibacillus anaericanus]RUT44513.1 VOC family protein [Paenibacillus anaericanus]